MQHLGAEHAHWPTLTEINARPAIMLGTRLNPLWMLFASGALGLL